jgi:hypothetical protein
MKLSDELYDKICVWMADHEDPFPLMESLEGTEEEVPVLDGKYEANMIDRAFDIIYDVYSAHVGEIPLGQRLMEEEENN